MPKLWYCRRRRKTPDACSWWRQGSASVQLLSSRPPLEASWKAVDQRSRSLIPQPGRRSRSPPPSGLLAVRKLFPPAWTRPKKKRAGWTHGWGGEHAAVVVASRGCRLIVRSFVFIASVHALLNMLAACIVSALSALLPTEAPPLLNSPVYSLATLNADGTTNMQILTYATPVGIERRERVDG